MIFTLPGRYDYLTKTNKIPHRGKKLRTVYILYLIDHIIKEVDNYKVTVHLYSIVLKQVCGNEYSYYVDYLIDTGFIMKTKNHSTGNHTSCQYKLIDNLHGMVLTYEFTDYILKKKLDRFFSTYNPLYKKSPIPMEIRQKLKDDLQSVSIDYEKSMTYLKTIEDENKIKYIKNLSMVNKIQNDDWFTQPDPYGRFHSNITNLKKYIRENFMMIDGQPVGSFDIKSSQLFFLSQVVKNDPLVVRDEGMNKFIEILEDRNQDIYMYFVNLYPEVYNHPDPKVNRDRSKHNLIVSMFDMEHTNTKYKSMFRKEFPTLMDYMEEYESCNCRKLWMTLQGVESEFIFKKVYMSVIKEFPNIKLITVHDSIYFPIQYLDRIKVIWDKHLNELISKK